MDAPSQPSGPQQRQPRRARLKLEDCIQYKDRIRHLYLVEQRTINNIIVLLQEEFNFSVTKSQLIHLVNEDWNFRKQLKPADHEYIAHVERKRKAEGKEATRVKLCGIVLDEEQLARKKARVFVSTFEEHQNALKPPNIMSPPQPIGLLVGTPTPRTVIQSPYGGIASVSSHTLVSPRDTGTPHEDDQSMHSLAGLPSANSPVLIMNPSSLYEMLPSFRLERIYETLLSKMRGAPTPSSPFVQSTSLPISKISDILLGGGTNDTALTRIKESDSFFSIEEFWEALRPLVVQMGNKSSDPATLRKSLDSFTGSDLPRRFSTILKLFFSNSTPIIDEFAVQTFYSAARNGELALLKLFMELGILKRSPKSRWGSYSRIIGATALQFSIEYRQGPATYLLLQNNIDLNAQPISDLSQSVLRTAVEVQDFELVNRLLELGADDIVFQEKYDSDEIKINYYLELKAVGLTWVNGPMGQEESPGLVQTALNAAVIMNDEDIFKAILLHRSVRVKFGKEPIPFDSASHIMATICGNEGRLKQILSCPALHIDIDAVSVHGQTALEIAAEMDYGDLIDILLDYGAQEDKPMQDTPCITAIHDPSRGEGFGKISKMISSSRLPKIYRIMEKLRLRSPSLTWYSYRQSLGCLSHRDFRLEFNIRSNSEQSNSNTHAILYDIVIYPNDFWDLKIFRSIEMFGGTLSASHFWFGDEFSLEIRFSFHDYVQVEELPQFLKNLETEIFAESDEHDGMALSDVDETDWFGAYTPDEILDLIKSDLRSSQNDVTEIDLGIINFCWEVDDAILHQQIIDLYSELLPRMTPSQLSRILPAAVHSNLHESIKIIIECGPILNKISSLEATWNGDITTFDMITDLAQQKGGFGISPEYLALITIHTGHVYKLVKLLDMKVVPVDHVLEGGITLLEVAAALGRLDITQVLLNAGATQRLAKAKAAAEKHGHFILSDIISKHINSLRADTNVPTPSDWSTPSAPTVASTPQPIVAESPRDPIVRELDLYMSSAGIQDMLSSEQYGLPSHWPMDLD
ncbi:hypothetical protein TWF694_002073 [Orbilia ellipsospora]|uniref:Clr5 domain-containing protein n=1 Tax=Orbilia ellipsospora TaxID=2528407 RepID=A0AAV9X5V0_9PEZI